MPNQEQPMSWKNLTGIFHLRRKDGTEEDIGPGQTFLASPKEVPRAFRDTIKPVDPSELEARVNPPLNVVDPGYRVVPGKVPGRFNVVDGQGKVMSGGLDKAAADAFLESLTK